MNLVVLEGNLARDPEVRVIDGKNGKTSVANITVAVNRYYKKANGDNDKETNFFRCEAWDTGAETIGKIFQKGDQILLNGSLKTDQWEKDGQKHSTVKVRIDQFKKLNRQKKVDEEGGEVTVPPEDVAQEPVTAGKTEIPF